MRESHAIAVDDLLGHFSEQQVGKKEEAYECPTMTLTDKDITQTIKESTG